MCASRLVCECSEHALTPSLSLRCPLHVAPNRFERHRKLLDKEEGVDWGELLCKPTAALDEEVKKLDEEVKKFKMIPWHKKQYQPDESDNDYETLPYIEQSNNVAYDTISKVLFLGKYRPDVVIGAAIDHEQKQAYDSDRGIFYLSEIKHVVSGVLRGLIDIVEDFVTSLVAILFPGFVVAAVVLGPYCYADLSALS